MKIGIRCSAGALVALAGQALAQPTIDGTRAGDESFYGNTPIWVQNQPTQFGDNAPGDPCNPTDIGNPGAVTTGVELCIPLADIGNPSTAGGVIKIVAFINGQGHDFASNQFLGGLPNPTANLGEPRNIDLSAPAGDQFVSVNLAGNSSITIDGQRDAGYTQLGLGTNRTGFGNATDGNPDFTNGSELDGVYAARDASNLYLFFSGNVESNFNKLEVFIDSVAGGQNQLRGDNANVDSDGLNRMGDDGGGNGLKFDASITADYYLGFTNGDIGAGDHALFANFAQLPTGGGGSGWYLGTGEAQTDGTLSGGDVGTPVILATIDNSNIDGVPGLCPPPAGDPDSANGSEIDALWAYCDESHLYLLITGNLQSNFNKLELFFDVTDGGQNRILDGTYNVPVDFEALHRMGDEGTGNGLTFEDGFEADYYMNVGNGSSGSQFFANAGVMRTDGPLRDFSGNVLDYSGFDGGAKSMNDPILFDGLDDNGMELHEIQDEFNPQPTLETRYAPRSAQLMPSSPEAERITVALDNSNIAGVTSSTVGDPGAVQTGVEICIAFDELGYDGSGPLKIAGFINAGGHDFVSNQVLGGIDAAPTAANLGEPRALDFNAVPGTQCLDVKDTGPACPHDLANSGTGQCGQGGDGVINSDDYICFLTLFSSGNLLADLSDSAGGCPGQNGVINSDDYICFLLLFSQGCNP